MIFIFKSGQSFTTEIANMQNSIVQKYNVPGPRYTSYPTVPYWDEALFSLELWKETLKKSFDLSLC